MWLKSGIPSIGVGAGVGVGVGVGEGLGEAVGLAVGVGTAVGLAVGVEVGVGVALPQAAATNATAMTMPASRGAFSRAISFTSMAAHRCVSTQGTSVFRAAQKARVELR
jgi:hypothetical protein